jgi:hypothetical protein
MTHRGKPMPQTDQPCEQALTILATESGLQGLKAARE